jgi:hypothetical protein
MSPPRGRLKVVFEKGDVRATRSRPSPERPILCPPWTSLPPTPNHLLLARGAYDSSLPSPIQTFPVTPMARQLAIPVNTVVLRILSNHGERAFTCLYRVRVSGTSEEVIRKAAAA